MVVALAAFMAMNKNEVAHISPLGIMITKHI